MTSELKCSTHSAAQHGFNRSASHNSGRYVCFCEGQVFDDEEEGSPMTSELKVALPELPEPGWYWLKPPDNLRRIMKGEPAYPAGFFDARQMQGYARLAVEADRANPVRKTVSPGERRYDFVRKLKPSEFAELFHRNIVGEGSFDSLVDAAATAAIRGQVTQGEE